MLGNRPVPAPSTAALHDRALADLRFIRETMEQASVTTFSGWALIGVGLLAVLVGTLASLARTRERWLLLWLALPGVSVPLAARHRTQEPRGGCSWLRSPRKFDSVWLPALRGTPDRCPLALDVSLLTLAPPPAARVWWPAVPSQCASCPSWGVGFMALGACAPFAPCRRGDLLLVVGFRRPSRGFRCPHREAIRWLRRARRAVPAPRPRRRHPQSGAPARAAPISRPRA